jgi:GT2 family glycosyltransferase
MKNSVFVVIPNWNGANELPQAIDSVLRQTYDNLKLVIVDNGSTDESRAIIKRYQKQDSRIESIYLDKNYGYTGGMNPGLERAIQADASYVAALNNDAVADKDWLRQLVEFLETHPDYGFAACNLQHQDGKTFDSTGDQYSIWGLPYPRGRNEPVGHTYDTHTDIFGASGGASLFRVATLRQVGLFDQDFFAYYEDIDLSFRAQLAGWKVGFVSKAKVYHTQGVTSAKMKDFSVYQSFKNFPMVVIKNVPKGLLHVVVPRFLLSYGAFFISAVRRGKLWPALKGMGTALRLVPKKLGARQHIQATRKVSVAYISSMLLHDLPPDQTKLRKLRSIWWRLKGKHS